MARGINKVIVLGNLGADPDARYMPNGNAVTNISVATTDSWKDKESGERQEKTEWHRVVVFNEGLIGVVESYVKKGTKLYIEGSLQTRKWTDESGNEKYTTEIVIQGYGGRIDIVSAKGSEQETPGDQDISENIDAPNKEVDSKEDKKKITNDKSDNLDGEDIPF